MRRREFIGGLGSTAIWPIAASAQPATRMRRVGLLTLLSQQDPGGRIAAFTGGMRVLGYIAGQTIEIDYRFADGDTELLRPLAMDLIALAPNVILAGEPSGARAVKAIAPDLPIVCPVLTDRLPDLFTSYARPNGTVTGLASNIEDLNARLVGVAQEIIPGIRQIGLLVNPRGANRTLVTEQFTTTAHVQGIAMHIEEAERPDQLVPALDRMMKTRAQMVIVPVNGMFINQRKTIIAHSLAAKLPILFQQRQDVEVGGLISYGVNETEGSRRAATFVDKILRGAKPADLLIEFSTKIELVINVNTAKALGLTIPPSLLARADEVIE